MPRLNYLVATCVLALSVGAANAAVFDVSGTFYTYTTPVSPITLGGTITINTTSGSLVGADLTVSGYAVPFTDVIPSLSTPFSSSPYSFWQVSAFTPDLLLGLEVVLETSKTPPPSPTLIGYAGGVIPGIFLDSYDGKFDIIRPLASCGGDFAYPTPCGSALERPPIATTPLAAALPLFATGLGVMGLLGWRRKRKNNAAIAAA
jgi:hypothetical protein